MPTFAELGHAVMPTDRVLDGRSFLPQLKGLKGNPRDSVLVHYDKDPGSAKPKFRRVRFAFDGKYKLYLDGRMIEVANDYLEQAPLNMKRATSQMRYARARLQTALDKMPKWAPDNSSFNGMPSKEFQKLLDLHANVIKARRTKE